MSVLAVIPARYASTRFPGKPLAPIAGKPMILRVAERVARCGEIDRIIVATDDMRIAEVCRTAGIETAMTAASHRSGTDRVVEVSKTVAAEIYVNVQGDEPLIAPSSIAAVIDRFRRGVREGIDVATVYLEGATPEQEDSSSVVHLVPTVNGRVLTFSRLPVPYQFAEPFKRTVHLGLYAFSRSALARFAARSPGPVERSESIELMRFLEFGDPVACSPVTEPSMGVDLPSDIAMAEAMLAATDTA